MSTSHFYKLKKRAIKKNYSKEKPGDIYIYIIILNIIIFNIYIKKPKQNLYNFLTLPVLFEHSVY